MHTEPGEDHKSGWILFGTRVLLASLTSLLLTLSFPPWDQGWLAWIALLPLILACRGGSSGLSLVLGYGSGFLASLGTFYWIFEYPGLRIYHVLLLAAYLALYPAVWCAAHPLLRRSAFASLAGAAGLWVGLDYLRANAGFLAISWATLAQSQHADLSLLQSATITGEYGITFLVVLANVALARTLTHGAWRSAVLAAALIAAVHFWGFREMRTAVPDDSLRVALAQPSILLSERATPSGREDTFRRLKELSREVALSRPALIAWPETAVRNLKNEPALMDELRALAGELDTHLLVGASEFLKFSRTVNEGGATRVILEPRTYNSAYLIRPDGPDEEPYHKAVLIPFTEYLPFEGIVLWPAWLVPAVFKHMAGDRRRIFQLAGETWFTVRICWEGIFSRHLRPSVREGARLLVQINNAVRFGRTAAGPQQNLTSILRAVEYRVAVIIASNTGPSAIVDPFGRVVVDIPGVFNQGTAVATVGIFHGETFYARRGDLFAWLSAALTALLLGWALLGRRRRAAPDR